jgi:hypothetical protein
LTGFFGFFGLTLTGFRAVAGVRRTGFRDVTDVTARSGSGARKYTRQPGLSWALFLIMLLLGGIGLNCGRKNRKRKRNRQHRNKLAGLDGNHKAPLTVMK